MSESPKPQPPLTPKPGAETQTLQTQSRFQAVLKAQSIKVLRGTIGVLEGVAKKLEAEPPAGKRSPAREMPSFLDKLQNWWSTALEKIRSLLPENLNQKLSDTALTSIIAVVAVVVVWLTSALGSSKPAEVANVPPAEPVPAANITTPPELTAPAAPQTVEVAPSPEPAPTPSPVVELTKSTQLPPSHGGRTLTPEQNLIVSIKKQIAEITDQYADGLIQSIQPNFQGSRLMIQVGDDWYKLNQSQQDKLAARMLERSRQLDFAHLEMTDPQGTLLARSPVVGNEMVILQRQVLKDL